MGLYYGLFYHLALLVGRGGAGERNQDQLPAPPPPNRETQQWNPLKAPDSHGKVLVVTLHEEHQLEHLIVSRPPAALQEEPRIQHASLFHPAGLYN